MARIFTYATRAFQACEKQDCEKVLALLVTYAPTGLVAYLSTETRVIKVRSLSGIIPVPYNPQLLYISLVS